MITSVPADVSMVTIARQNGISEYAVFAEYASGESIPSPHFYISK